MDQIFDMFGDLVSANYGRRGRPQHVATQENRNKVNMLLAFGWNNERIAKALSITPPTLRKNYFRELKFRDEARDRLDARLAVLLWSQVESGNVAAMKEFRKLVEHNDLMLYGQKIAPEQKAKEPKLGKKEQMLVAAREPDTGTTLGDLMARRQGGGSRPN